MGTTPTFLPSNYYQMTLAQQQAWWASQSSTGLSFLPASQGGATAAVAAPTATTTGTAGAATGTGAQTIQSAVSGVTGAVSSAVQVKSLAGQGKTAAAQAVANQQAQAVTIQQNVLGTANTDLGSLTNSYSDFTKADTNYTQVLNNYTASAPNLQAQVTSAISDAKMNLLTQQASYAGNASVQAQNSLSSALAQNAQAAAAKQPPVWSSDQISSLQQNVTTTNANATSLQNQLATRDTSNIPDSAVMNNQNVQVAIQNQQNAYANVTNAQAAAQNAADTYNLKEAQTEPTVGAAENLKLASNSPLQTTQDSIAAKDASLPYQSVAVTSDAPPSAPISPFAPKPPSTYNASVDPINPTNNDFMQFDPRTGNLTISGGNPSTVQTGNSTGDISANIDQVPYEGNPYSTPSINSLTFPSNGINSDEPSLESTLPPGDFSKIFGSGLSPLQGDDLTPLNDVFGPQVVSPAISPILNPNQIPSKPYVVQNPTTPPAHAGMLEGLGGVATDAGSGYGLFESVRSGSILGALTSFAGLYAGMKMIGGALSSSLSDSQFFANGSIMTNVMPGSFGSFFDKIPGLSQAYNWIMNHQLMSAMIVAAVIVAIALLTKKPNAAEQQVADFDSLTVYSPGTVLTMASAAAFLTLGYNINTPSTSLNGLGMTIPVSTLKSALASGLSNADGSAYSGGIPYNTPIVLKGQAPGGGDEVMLINQAGIQNGQATDALQVYALSNNMTFSKPTTTATGSAEQVGAYIPFFVNGQVNPQAVTATNSQTGVLGATPALSAAGQSGAVAVAGAMDKSGVTVNP